MNEIDQPVVQPKCPWRIKALAIFLIVFFAFGTVGGVIAYFAVGERLGLSLLQTIFSTVINLGFVCGGIGMLRLRPWSLWLTVGLCGLSIVTLLWQLFTKLTPESATKPHEIASYVVAAFYLAIAFYVT